MNKTLKKEHIEKCWTYLENAQKEVRLKYTGHNTTDEQIRECYQKIEMIKEEVQKLANKIVEV